MYKPESWYKLRDGCILVQITPLQDFGAEMEGGGGFYSRAGLYFECYGTSEVHVVMVMSLVLVQIASTVHVLLYSTKCQRPFFNAVLSSHKGTV